MSAERRRHPRNRVTLWAIQQQGGRTVRRRASSLSSGGLFMDWPAPAVAVGDLLVLDLQAMAERPQPPGAGAAVVRVTAEVARVTSQGVGLRITRADWDRLGRLLEA